MRAHGILFLLVAVSACDAAVEETNQEWNERSMNAVTRALGPAAPPVFRNVRFVGPATCGEYQPENSEFRRLIGFGPGESRFGNGGEASFLPKYGRPLRAFQNLFLPLSLSDLTLLALRGLTARSDALTWETFPAARAERVRASSPFGSRSASDGAALGGGAVRLRGALILDCGRACGMGSRQFVVAVGWHFADRSALWPRWGVFHGMPFGADGEGNTGSTLFGKA